MGLGALRSLSMRSFLRRLVVAALMLGPCVAFAAAPGPLDNCIELDAYASPVIDNGVLTSTQTFRLDQVNDGGAWSIYMVYFELTDANGSVDRLDLTCTGSLNSNTSDSIPLTCTDADSDGIFVCVATGVFRTTVDASGGVEKHHLPIEIVGVPDVECSFTVGTGAATASVDTIDVWRRLCTR
jgi:hypothetical protein